MIRKLDNMLDVYGKNASIHDYLNRVLASFAEIYNYDYSLSALMEDGSLFKETEPCIRKNGIIGRIRAFYENRFNEKEINTKLYYNEVVCSDKEDYEYGYLTLGNIDYSLMADMIALGKRILEACGLKDIFVYINDKGDTSLLKEFLDYLDIDYEIKNFHEKDLEIAFKIVQKKDNKELTLIHGGDYSNISEKMSGLKGNAFGFSGSLEILKEACKDTIKLDDKMLDVVITYKTKKECLYAYYLGQELRLNGFKTEIITKSEKSFIKEFYNTKYVISLNEKDLDLQELLLVDLYTNEREKIKEMDLIQHLDINF